MKKSLELKTPKELERDQFHSKIIAEYQSMRKKYEDASAWRIFTDIARRHSLTPMGVMRICERKEVYHTKVKES